MNAEAILREVGPKLGPWAAQLAGNREDAEDLAQEVRILIARYAHTFDSRSKPTTWAYRLMSNTWINEIRRRARRPSTVYAPDLPDPVAECSEIRYFEDAMEVQAVLESLDPEVAETLTAFAQFGMKDAAVMLGIPEGTVKSRVWRARQALERERGR